METAKLFNLRRIEEPALDIKHPISGSKITSVAFDQYGTHLLAGVGNSLGLYNVKNVNEPAYNFEAHEGVVNVAKFSPSGQLIVSGAEDRFLKIHSL